ncbi:MAG: aspartate kinase [Exilispira sp.]
MDIDVLKFGGSSVATKEKIISIAHQIKELYLKNRKIVVVVSAMGNYTNELLKLAYDISPKPPEREVDIILTTGERISMALLSISLNDIGIPAVSFTGSQAGIITNNSHMKAKIENIKPIRLIEELSKDKVVIVAGFQGVSQEKNITTLGRGGSDLTAIALAASLKAKNCEICTDVDGIFPVNPKIFPQAKPYEKLNHKIVYFMAKTGAKVMHDRACSLALNYNLKYKVRSSFNSQGGTMVSDYIENINETPSIYSINYISNLHLIKVNNSNAQLILESLAIKDINIHNLTYNKDEYNIFIKEEDYIKIKDDYEFEPFLTTIFYIISSGFNDYSGSYYKLHKIIESIGKKPYHVESNAFLDSLFYIQDFEPEKMYKDIVNLLNDNYKILNFN